MIKLKCNDILLFKTINALFEQKNLTNKLNHEKYFAVIRFDYSKTNLYLIINGEETVLKTPININYFFSTVLNIVVDVRVPIGNCFYFPYKRALTNNNRKSLLSDIQNVIISNLISNNGINKHTLYSLIWKKDKDISINKLDTHLTNLKNQLKKELGIEINFQSNDKILKLMIN